MLSDDTKQAHMQAPSLARLSIVMTHEHTQIQAYTWVISGVGRSLVRHLPLLLRPARRATTSPPPQGPHRRGTAPRATAGREGGLRPRSVWRMPAPSRRCFDQRRIVRKKSCCSSSPLSLKHMHLGYARERCVCNNIAARARPTQHLLQQRSRDVAQAAFRSEGGADS